MDNEAPYNGSLYRLFYVFIDPEEYIAEIPGTFVEWFGNRVSCTVTFKDPSKNTYNIRLTNAADGWAFTSGIQRLLSHYRLNRGSWVRIFYMGGSEFFIQLMNRDSVAVRDHYVLHHRYEFGWNYTEKEYDPYDNDKDDDDWNNMEISDITICASHLIKNRKALPSHFVRDAILPMNPSYCVLRDQYRGRFFCEYQFCKNNDEHCTITGGWLDFVSSNNLREGTRVRLGIVKGYPSLIHAKVIRAPVGGKFKMEKKSAMKKVREIIGNGQCDVKIDDHSTVDGVNVEPV